MSDRFVTMRALRLSFTIARGVVGLDSLLNGLNLERFREIGGETRAETFLSTLLNRVRRHRDDGNFALRIELSQTFRALYAAHVGHV